jgi:hypothetical protein
MMMELITPKPNPIIDTNRGVNVSPSQVDSFPCVEIVEQSTNSHREKDLEDVDTSSKGKDASPSSDYDSNAQIPMPCILPHGPPPLLLDYNQFGDWKFLMRSYMRSASIELWRIIEEGYSPRDHMNLTRREVVDNQLNAIAINMIHLAITPKDRAHIHSLKTAKEAWDKLDMLFLKHVNNSKRKLEFKFALFREHLKEIKRQSSRVSCYNCGDKRHLVAECIFERRDEHDGKLVRKSGCRPLLKGLPKLFPNNEVSKISSTEKPRTNMLEDEDHMVENEGLEKKKELELDTSPTYR